MNISKLINYPTDLVYIYISVCPVPKAQVCDNHRFPFPHRLHRFMPHLRNWHASICLYWDMVVATPRKRKGKKKPKIKKNDPFSKTF
jgi:hypothetical protein